MIREWKLNEKRLERGLPPLEKGKRKRKAKLEEKEELKEAKRKAKLAAQEGALAAEFDETANVSQP